MLFGSLKGTGTPILGKQGSKTSEQVSEAGIGEQKKRERLFFVVVVVFLFWRVLFGRLKGIGTTILGKQGSKTSERVPEGGTRE